MKRKVLSTTLCMFLLLAACGGKEQAEAIQMGARSISECAAEETYAEIDESTEMNLSDDGSIKKGNSIMNEESLSEEEKVQRASEEILGDYIRENERIDKVLDNTYVTTIMVNLKCNSRMPFAEITTEDDVEMAKDFLGYDFCWTVEDYPIEDFAYMIKYSDGYSAPRGYRLTGIKYNEAHSYYYVDYELGVFQGDKSGYHGYLDIVVIPKEILSQCIMNEEPMRKIVSEYPEEQILDVYYTNIGTRFGYQVAPSICKIATENELENSKEYISSDGLLKIAEKFSIEEYDYLIGFPVSLYGKTDSVRLCKDSIYFHQNTDGNYPTRNNPTIYLGEMWNYSMEPRYFFGAYIAVVPKGFLEENSVEVRSIQEYYDYFERLK